MTFEISPEICNFNVYRLYYDFAPGFFPAEMLHFIAADFTGTFTLRDGNLFPFCFDSC